MREKKRKTIKKEGKRSNCFGKKKGKLQKKKNEGNVLKKEESDNIEKEKRNNSTEE